MTTTQQPSDSMTWSEISSFFDELATQPGKEAHAADVRSRLTEAGEIVDDFSDGEILIAEFYSIVTPRAAIYDAVSFIRSHKQAK